MKDAMKHMGVRMAMLLAATIVGTPTALYAQVSDFTYQGVLQEDGSPANGTYDFTFELWTLAGGGSQIGGTELKPGVVLSNGLFVVELDFGGGAFDGSARWLEIAARPAGGGGYTTLSPRTKVNPAPYAMLSATVPTSAIASSHVLNNSLTASDLAANSVTASEIAGSAVGASEIATGAVGASEIATGAVASPEVLDNSLTAADLAPNSVTASEIASSAVGSSEIASGAVGWDEIAAGSVASSEVVDNSLTGADLADTIDLGSSGVNGLLRIYSSAAGGRSLQLLGGETAGGRIWLFNNSGVNGVWMAGDSSDGGVVRLYNTNGAARVELDGQGVDGAGQIRVAEEPGTYTVDIQGGDGNGGEIYVYDAAGNTAGLLAGTSAFGGYQYLYNRDGDIGLLLDGDSGNAGYLAVRNTNGANRVLLDGYSTGGGGRAIVYAGDGSTTVDLTGDSAGAGELEVNNNVSQTRVRLDGESTGTGGEISVFDADGTETVEILGAESSGTGAQIDLADAAGVVTISLDADFNGDGRIITEELQITGGSDLSEQFDVAARTGEVLPGMVVCIDADDPGRLAVSSKAYDRTVAGVVSGAGGVKPGMMMGQQGSLADGDHPVALSGRVYCMVDASEGAIEPGDLITTSNVPGHGMKVTDHDRAPGAVIGKAMTPLAEGRGLVLMLVSLQ